MTVTSASSDKTVNFILQQNALSKKGFSRFLRLLFSKRSFLIGFITPAMAQR